MAGAAGSSDGPRLDPAPVLRSLGPLPYALLETLCGRRAVDDSESRGAIRVDRGTHLARCAVEQPDPQTLRGAELGLLAARLLDTRARAARRELTPDTLLRIAELLESVDRYDAEIVRLAARTALLRGDRSTALSILRHGLRHDPEDVALLHLRAMALEALGMHGAATGSESATTALSDPAWLGRWASNLFLSTGRTVERTRFETVPDDEHEMRASLLWIQALDGDVGAVAAGVNEILDDPRASPQAVVWACVAGSVPAALDGRGAIGRAMLDHCRSLVAEFGDTLSPFAELQVGLTDVLVHTRLGRIDEAVAMADRGRCDAASDFPAAAWSCFGALARREAGDFELARSMLDEGIAVVGSDPFGLVVWARSEVAVCEAMDEPSGPSPCSRSDSGSGRPTPRAPDTAPVDGHGLFRSCLLRNAGWIEAARGRVDDAIDRVDAAFLVARDLGQNAHAALALLDLARFGEPVRASTLLGELSAFDSPLITAAAATVEALASRDIGSIDTASELLAATGMRLQADELLHLQRELVSSQAAPGAVARLDLLRMPRCRPTPLFAEVPAVNSVLTEREVEVARSAAAGASSRTIGEALGISVRTVDNLLGRVYQKCHFDGRHELRAFTSGA